MVSTKEWKKKTHFQFDISLKLEVAMSRTLHFSVCVFFVTHFPLLFCSVFILRILFIISKEFNDIRESHLVKFSTWFYFCYIKCSPFLPLFNVVVTRALLFKTREIKSKIWKKNSTFARFERFIIVDCSKSILYWIFQDEEKSPTKWKKTNF